MSFHYSLELAEEFWEDNCSDGEPSVQLNKNLTASAFCSKDKMTRFSRLSQYGMTYEPLTEDDGKALLTWFLEGFHAPTSQLQAKAQASKEKKVGCGQKWRGSLGKYDHSTHSLKTAQCSLLEASTQCSVTLPNWGLMQNGDVFQQPKSEQITKGIEFGLSLGMWPTPSSRDHKGGYQGGRIRNGKVSWDTLDAAVQHTDNKEKTGGQLNPTWVEWLMGWPLGHTDLKRLEMDKYQKWLELHGRH